MMQSGESAVGCVSPLVNGGFSVIKMIAKLNRNGNRRRSIYAEDHKPSVRSAVDQQHTVRKMAQTKAKAALWTATPRTR